MLAGFPAARRSRATTDAGRYAACFRARSKGWSATPLLKEQCFLYTELVHNYTAIAGKQLADGETEKAKATLKRVQGFVAHIHDSGLAQRHQQAEECGDADATCDLAQSGASICITPRTRIKAVVEATLKQLEKRE